MSYFRLGSGSSSIRTKKAGRCLLVGILAFLFCLPLFSQTSQGTIQGGVFDQSGGAIAGATVTVIDVARGVTRALIARWRRTVRGYEPDPRHVYGARRGQRLPDGGAQRRAGGGGSKHSRGSGGAARRANPDDHGHRRSPGDQYHRRHLGRNGQQRGDQCAALEWPQLRALAATASGSRYGGGRRYGPTAHKPTAGARTDDILRVEGIAGIAQSRRARVF